MMVRALGLGMMRLQDAMQAESFQHIREIVREEIRPYGLMLGNMSNGHHFLNYRRGKKAPRYGKKRRKGMTGTFEHCCYVATTIMDEVDAAGGPQALKPAQRPAQLMEPNVDLARYERT